MRSMSSDSVRVVRPPALPGLELLAADYAPRSFPMHTHPEYVVGAVVAGAERLRFHDADFLLPAGDTLFIRPDVPHANEAAHGQRFGYCVLYIGAALFRSMLGRDGDGDAPDGLALFDRRVARSPALFALVLRSHRRLCRAHDALEQQSLLALLVGGLAEAGATAPTRHAAVPSRMADVRRHLDEHFSETVALDTLATIGRVSPFHLVRAFKHETGLTPVAYRTQRRITEACRLLRASTPIAEVALATGFADQSHLTRQFQRIMGVSPGRYAPQ
jgi:AraC-like DNA-binding protein